MVVLSSSLNSSIIPGHIGPPGTSATLVLPSSMPRSAGNSPAISKPAGASPLVPSCRSAFSVTSHGMLMSTSPYSDSAALDHPRRVTSVRQMAQLFEDASSWQRDVRRQRHLAVNSELFFFPTSSTTTTNMSVNYNAATVNRLGSAVQRHNTSADFPLETSRTYSRPVHSFNPFKLTGVTSLHFEVFSTILV